MELDLDIKQQLADLLAEPATVTHEHAGMLANLAKVYPYYQPLHLLLAKANTNAPDSSQSLATAALYNGGNLLHQVIHQPETLTKQNINLVSFAIKADENLESEQIEPVEDLEFIDHNHRIADEQETFEEIAEFALPTEVDKVENEQEIFDEIVEVNTVAFASKQEAEPNVNHDQTIADDLAIENIVATDFFAFEKSFSPESISNEEPKPAVPLVEEYDQEAEAQTVSKYDDDKLPYTFLWWLAKTRKEHEQIFQPYVTPKNTNINTHVRNPNELQQQFVEHIFHLQTPFNVAEEAGREPLNKQLAHKGTQIIDSFIKNEPQIRPPKAEQINTENKAKKSAEDHNDLVSETLAAIYIEQMLYHKAIDTYEKLSLKFPEKSRYFADLIQSLEKKI